MARSILRFGPYVLDPATGELRKRDKLLRLPPQAFNVLALLARRAGETVTREEIRREIWGDGTFVDFDLGLYHCLTHIRAVLGDDPRTPRYVETRPRRGYRFLAPVERAPLAAPPSIAVLPFENLNHDPAFEYFADGITDALITELGEVGGLRVIARQSVVHLKGSERNIAQIARDLDVDAIVEGAALRAGKCVRVTAQLIGLEPERHIWAQSYECELRDVIGLQSVVASAVARHVCAALTNGSTRAPTVRSVDPAAQDAYLRARHHLSMWTREGFQHGLEYLQQSIAMDPDFAPAQAALADCFALLGFWGHLPIWEAYPKAKTAASTAVRLDPRSSDAHHSLAFILWLHDWDLQGTEREIARAIALNPSSERTRLLKALYLATMTFDRAGAQAEARHAASIDPLGIFTNSSVAWVSLFVREYEQAIARARRTIDLYPDSLQAHYVLGLAQAVQGHPAEAVRTLERAVEISPDAISIGYLAYANGMAGARGTAQALLNALLEKTARGYVPPKSVVCACIGVGDLDGAFAALEQAFAVRDGFLFWVPVVPVFDSLRADARFDDFARRLTCEFRRPERRSFNRSKLLRAE